MEASQLEHHLAHSEPTPWFNHKIITQVAKIVAHHVEPMYSHRKSVLGITIDWPTTTDADDAIWCEKIRNWFRVYVSITDVSGVIPIFSPLDMEAMIRSTSMYFHPHVIPMLPDGLSSDLYSLNGKRRHPCITVQFDVDNQGRIIHKIIYESLLENQRCFHHAEFMEERWNEDSPYIELIKNLFTVTERLNKNSWINLGVQWLSESIEDWWDKWGNEVWWNNVHTMIATLMVTANQLVAEQLYSGDRLWVYRQHLHTRERAFYTLDLGEHVWLGIYPPSGYTHFTSPLRRFPDMIVHRLLKAILDKNYDLPYSREQLDVINGYVNKRLTEVEIIRSEHNGKKIVEKAHGRLGRAPRTHDLKSQIKKWASTSYYVIPQAIRKSIIDDISDPDSRTWQWSVGIILLCKDYELKHLLFQKISWEKKMTTRAFFNTLCQTRLILWEQTIFQLEESTDANVYIVRITLPDGKVLSSQSSIKTLKWARNLNRHKWSAKRRLMMKVFRYYLKWNTNNTTKIQQ